MKEVIKKVLNETVNAKELLSKGEEINNIYRSLSDTKISGNRRTGETSWDELFWFIIDMVDYKSDNDYRRINKLFIDLNRFAGVSTNLINKFRSILGFKIDVIESRIGNDVRGVSDDSWSDVRYDVVSRGKDFYNKALNDYTVVQKMIDNDDYKESFSYAIPYEDELI